MPQPAKAAAPAGPATREGEAPPDVSHEEALAKGVWPLLGLAPMDETDYTLPGA